MPLRRSQSLAWAVTITIAMSLVLIPAARTQDVPPGEGFCQVWPAEVVAPIIGAESAAEVHPSSLTDSCEWSVNPVVPRSHDPNAPWTTAIIGWEDTSLDRFMGDHPGGHSAQVGSVVGWYGDGSILLPVNDGDLYIGVVAAVGVDVEAAVLALAELAISRMGTLPPPPTPIPSSLFTEGFCGLWSPTEVEAILGAAVNASPSPTDCMWASADAAAPSVFLMVNWASGTLADTESGYPDGHEVSIGSATGWFVQDLGLWVPIGGGLLWIQPMTAPELDQEPAAIALGELALERAPKLLTAPTPEPTLPRLPDPVADALCALWSPEELSQALGTTVAGSTYVDRCTWSDGAAEPLMLDAYWVDATLDERRSDDPSGHDVPVGTITGWLTGGFYQTVYLPLEQGLLAIALSGAPPDVDPEVTVLGLAELALTRSETLPGPPTPAPVEPPANDPELDTTTPATVGDETLIGSSYRGSRQFASTPPEQLQSLTEAVADVGKTLDDVSMLWRMNGRGDVPINALRIRDADIAAVMPRLMEYAFLGEDLPQQAVLIAGKPVTALTFRTGAHAYVYQHGDTMWTIRAGDPALSEILSALP